MNLYDLLLIAGLCVCIGLALRFVFRRKKQGGCCGNCGNCGQCENCSGKGKL